MVITSDRLPLPEDRRPNIRHILFQYDIPPLTFVECLIERDIPRHRAICIIVAGKGTVTEIDLCLAALSQKVQQTYTRKNVGGFTFDLAPGETEEQSALTRALKIPKDTNLIYPKTMKKYGAVVDKRVSHPERKEGGSFFPKPYKKVTVPLGTYYEYNENEKEKSTKVEITFPNGYTVFTEKVKAEGITYDYVYAHREPGKNIAPLEPLET